MEKVLLISFKPNFTPNTFGCYGLNAKKKIKEKKVNHHNIRH